MVSTLRFKEVTKVTPERKKTASQFMKGSKKKVSYMDDEVIQDINQEIEKGDKIRVIEERNEKRWKDMSPEEKRKAYDVAIESGDMKDTFEGFSKQMWRSTFDVDTGEPIEVR